MGTNISKMSPTSEFCHQHLRIVTNLKSPASQCHQHQCHFSDFWVCSWERTHGPVFYPLNSSLAWKTRKKNVNRLSYSYTAIVNDQSLLWWILMQHRSFMIPSLTSRQNIIMLINIMCIKFKVDLKIRPSSKVHLGE